MIPGELTYYIVHGILVAAGIVSIVIARKRIPDKRTRKNMIIALSLISFSGILMSVCQKIYRLAPSAYTADTVGITEGLHGKVLIFRHLASLGYIMDVAVIAMLIVLAKKILSNQTADPVKSSEDAAEEVQK